MNGKFTIGRLIAILMCIVMVATMLPAVASAEKLSAPKMKKATLVEDGIKVTWKGSSGASGYRVYRRTSNKQDWKAIADVTKKAYVDTKPISGATNYYAVRALKADGTPGSNYSDNPVGSYYMKAPTKLKATVGETSITLTWKAVKAAPLYRIDRKAKGSSWKALGTTKATTYVDTKATSGKEYSYRVKVVTADNKVVLSLPSKEVTAIYSDKVTVTSLANKTDHILVQWNKVKGAKKYRLFRKTEDGDWFKVDDIKGTAYADYDVVNNVRYTYYLRCLNSKGEVFGRYDPGKGTTFYVPPTMRSCTNADKSLLTEWQAVDGISYYVVFRRIVIDSVAGEWMKIGLANGVSYNDTTAPSGTYCEYTAACADASGNLLSTYGNSVVGATSYMDSPVLTSIACGIGSIKIEWLPVDLAPNYVVYRYIGDAVPTVPEQWEAIGTATDTTYEDTTANQNNRRYWYSVAVGDVAATIPAPALLSMLNLSAISIVYYAPPTINSVTNELGGAMVSWGKVDGASYYNVYKWTGNGAWTLIAENLPATSSSYTDPDVVNSGHYWYSVSCKAQNESAHYDETNGAKSTKFYWAPEITGLSNGDGNISISWGPVDGAGFYRLTLGDTILQEATARSYTMYTPDPGKMYKFKVCFVDANGFRSALREGDIRYLTKPVITGASSPYAKAVTLTWDPVIESSTMNIRMSATKDGSSGWISLGTVETSGAVPTTKTLKDLSVTGQYMWFQIQAVSGSGNYTSVWSDSVQVYIK